MSVVHLRICGGPLSAQSVNVYALIGLCVCVHVCVRVHACVYWFVFMRELCIHALMQMLQQKWCGLMCMYRGRVSEH